MPQPAARLKQLPTYFFATLAQNIQSLQSKGIDVISLDIGSPDMPPPTAVINKLAEASHRSNAHGYAGYRGTSAFRESIAHYYKTRFGVDLDPETEVLPLLGSKEGIVNLSLAYLDAGDAALVPDIGYPSYSMGARLAGAEVFWIPTTSSSGFIPDLRSINSADVDRAKLLWVNFPNNPTGATVNLDFYREAIKLCNSHSLILASDNPYVDVTYNNFCAPSALEADPGKTCTIEFMSFSKTFNMGGWRLGAAVGNAQILKTLLQVKSNVDSGHFIPIYEAGITALETTPKSWIEERNAIYQRRRDQILDVLPSIGLQANKTLGSLYIWAKVEQWDGDTYVQRALSEAHVALAPGSAYGPGGKSFVRISLGVPDVRLNLALQYLQDWYTSIR
jgi:LL-diaminopimelate aminotransferase